ncbi:hypothetical protein E6C27_scaffold34G002520 [Cucumis melo var. makuwa]|uniref:NBS-LRR type resistance protein n=1 Tax=Cucumis melo var. makuwa TaxID=1194695 RepID=A0A5A7SJG5_CUCMM|nr:hypothetical protein E6C27_scaffold34G002520 [Cucumis melo var. makuwa]
MHTSISLVILSDTHISLVIPKDVHISLVISKDAHISLVIPKDTHSSLVIPTDAHISLVVPKDAHISLVIPKDTVPISRIEREGGSGRVVVRNGLKVEEEEPTTATTGRTRTNNGWGRRSRRLARIHEMKRERRRWRLANSRTIDLEDPSAAGCARTKNRDAVADVDVARWTTTEKETAVLALSEKKEKIKEGGRWRRVKELKKKKKKHAGGCAGGGLSVSLF